MTQINEWTQRKNQRLALSLGRHGAGAPTHERFVVEGQLKRVVGLTLEAEGCQVEVGGRCQVETANGRNIEAEVVGFAGDRAFLMPTGEMSGLLPDARVVPDHRSNAVAVGDAPAGPGD